MPVKDERMKPFWEGHFGPLGRIDIEVNMSEIEGWMGKDKRLQTHQPFKKKKDNFWFNSKKQCISVGCLELCLMSCNPGELEKNEGLIGSMSIEWKNKEKENRKNRFHVKNKKN